VLGLTAVLGETTPARHAGHVAHVADVNGGRDPIRATMEQLHEAGGVPRGWVFRLPSGNPRRGRDVFVRLECFRCHRLRGESYPPPSGAGPELTGIGGHHPRSYIAESILDPNAVIIEGPGYTGPDGRSTMPAQVGLWFTGALEPAYSRVQVLDAAGHRRDLGDDAVDPANRALLRVSVPALPPGPYRVVWRVLSVDSHLTEGEFSFRVIP